jgi:pescadillo protein
MKGIYPREPKKKLKGKDKTYYLRKDIKFLLHDPLLKTFRDKRTFTKKLRKAKGRRDFGTISRLHSNKPTYTLDHIIKERYPAFVDALKDLDDALSMVHLFASLTPSDKVKAGKIERCKALCHQFQYYVMRTHALRKVFLSIKGIYYQAEVFGHRLTWLVPYRFSQYIPKDVDLHVMLTFLEFYETFLGFVLFKLFSHLGLNYPPQLDVSPLSAVIEPPKTDNEEGQQSNKRKSTPHSKLFASCFFWLGREVPQESLAFVIKSFGGQVGVESLEESTQVREADERITHAIVDRPTQKHQYLSREYVQPQWVYDSSNVCFLLPIHEYLPGVSLPPHLSPFVDDATRGYVPARRQQIDALISQQSLASPSATQTGPSHRQPKSPRQPTPSKPVTEEEQAAAMEAQYFKELEEERGVKAAPRATQPHPASKTKAEKKEARRRRLAEEETEEYRRSLMLSKKQKRRLARKQKNEQAATKAVNKLHEKRQALDRAAQKQNPRGQ